MLSILKDTGILYASRILLLYIMFKGTGGILLHKGSLSMCSVTSIGTEAAAAAAAAATNNSSYQLERGISRQHQQSTGIIDR